MTQGPMTPFSGKFCPQKSSFLYRPHPIRGNGTLNPTAIGLKLTGFRGGEEERPALILGTIFLTVCVALIKLGLNVAINWGALAGFAFLLFLFAYITQRRRPREVTIPWTALGSIKAVEDDKVETLVKYSGQTRYVRFQLDESSRRQELLEACKERREMSLEETEG